jgi:hypothetical protein
MSNKVPCGWTVKETKDGVPTRIKAPEGSLTVDMKKTDKGWLVSLQGCNFYNLIGDWSPREACFEATMRAITEIEKAVFREKELLAKMTAEEENA